MVDQGPTTTGSINAKIGATITELEEKVATVKGLVKELTGTPTNLKVGADVSEAVAKLSAVEAAQRKLGTATQSLQIAYQRLDEVQTKGGASESRLMALHLAATRAENAHADAVRGLAAAQAEEAVAEDTTTAATKRSNDAQRQHLQYWQQIAIAVAALIPLMGPLSAYAFGVAGAFGAMGAAGVLAILGINNAMKQQTDLGALFSSNLRGAKSDLEALANTAAASMFHSLNFAVDQLNAAFPLLNNQTRIFSQQLGTAGNFLLGALLTGLKIAQPLLIEAGEYIENIAAGLLSWTKGGGFQSFVQYAVAQLPRVAAALGELAQLVIRFVQASAPIGTVVLQALAGVASALNAIPIEVLTALIAGGGSFFLAFKAWAALTPILESVAVSLGAVGAAEDLALGPIGLVIAAVTALGVAVGITTFSMQEATKAQEDYSDAVQRDNGIVGENVKAQAAKALAQDGAVKSAKALGIQVDSLVAASLREVDGHQKASAALSKQIDWQKYATGYADSLWQSTDKNSASNQKYAGTVDQLTGAMDGQQKAVKKAIDAYNEQQQLLGGLTISSESQLQAQVDLANQYGTSIGTYENARAAQKQTADQLRATTVQMQLQNDASKLLKNALDILDGKSLDVAQTQTGMAAANNALTDSLHKNGKVVDGNSKAAVANQQAIQQSIVSAEQYAEAVGQSTGSSEQARQALINSKQSMEDTLQSQGLLTSSVQAYIDKIFQIPASLPPTKLDVDNAAAKQKLQDELDLLNRINAASQSRYEGLAAKYAAMGLEGPPKANGGTIQAFAGGGESGTVFGSGSSTSDSILTRLSVGEEVTKTSSANYPGVRPLLKSLNYDPSGTMAALASRGGGSSRSYALHVDGAGWSPDQLFAEFQRRMSAQQNARVA